jgi:chromosome segregation ATPase
VLPFGPIVSDTLNAKYQSQVDINSVVERHSAALIEKQRALKEEAAHVQHLVLAREQALRTYDALDSAVQQLEHCRGQSDQLRSQIEEQERSLSSLNHRLWQTSADLQRAQSMGAIRKFFSGLNEDELRGTLRSTHVKIKGHEDSLRAASAQVQQSQSEIAQHTDTVEQLRREPVKCPTEAECRADLHRQQSRLEQLAGQIKAIDIRVQSRARSC